jgi:hypothetical protein
MLTATWDLRTWSSPGVSGLALARAPYPPRLRVRGSHRKVIDELPPAPSSYLVKERDPQVEGRRVTPNAGGFLSGAM